MASSPAPGTRTSTTGRTTRTSGSVRAAAVTTNFLCRPSSGGYRRLWPRPTAAVHPVGRRTKHPLCDRHGVAGFTHRPDIGVGGQPDHPASANTLHDPAERGVAARGTQSGWTNGRTSRPVGQSVGHNWLSRPAAGFLQTHVSHHCEHRCDRIAGRPGTPIGVNWQSDIEISSSSSAQTRTCARRCG
jgi:hypothetical protein